MERYSKAFSVVMFWIENCILIAGFAIFGLILLPFAFLKTLSNIALYVDAGFLRKLILVFFWVTIGLFIDFYLLYQDISNLIFILSHLNGFN